MRPRQYFQHYIYAAQKLREHLNHISDLDEQIIQVENLHWHPLDNLSKNEMTWQHSLETKISNLLRTKLKITLKIKFNWNTGLLTALAYLQLSHVHEPLQARKHSWQCLDGWGPGGSPPTPRSGHQGLLESLWPCLAVDGLIQYLRFHWCSTGFSSGNVFITACSWSWGLSWTSRNPGPTAPTITQRNSS